MRPKRRYNPISLLHQQTNDGTDGPKESMAEKSYRTGDQALVRSINLSTVLRCLWDGRPLSRADIAARTHLNKATVSSLVNDLQERGLVCELGQRASSGGRPAELLDLNPQAGLIVGVEIGADFIYVILADWLAHIRWRRRRAIAPLASQETIIAALLDMLDEAVARAAGQRLLGVGLALRGLVDISRGVSVFFPNFQWRNVPLRQIVHERCGLPVFVDNDANAAALGERLFGLARAADDFVYVVIGMGIGAGIYINGQMYRGAGGYAGEVGHTNLSLEHTRPCHCGARGCWETLANQYALIERVQAALAAQYPSLLASRHGRAPRLSVERIGQAAADGDQVALQALAETGAVIGVGIANLINIFNPQLVIVGGAMHTVLEHMLPAIRQQVAERAFREMSHMVTIEPGVHGRNACAIGAVALVVQDILDRSGSVPRVR